MIVGINPWVLQHDPVVFPEPERFEPERWLEWDGKEGSSKEKLAEQERYFFSFGAGSRVCIGRNASSIEMRKVIPLLVGEFEMEFEDGEGAEWKVRNVWFTQQEMPKVVLKRRAKKER